MHELTKQFESQGIDKVKVGGFDIDGVLRGKYISLKKFESALENGFGFCDVIFGWDSMDELYEGVPIEVTGWATGYPDTHARIDTSTLRRIPWEGGQPFFLLDFSTPSGAPLAVSPRQLLQKVVGEAEEMGYLARFSAEFEYWLFRESPASVRDKGYRALEALTPGMFGYSCLRASENHELIGRIFSEMGAFGVPLEGIHTETGPGVWETAITYDDVLKAADQAALFKTGLKEIAVREGLMATFMAKWSQALPGSSGHLHQSLWTLDGSRPLFADDTDPQGMSAVFRHYLAGVLATLPDFTALYAPTINSYRRLVPGMWAPTRACWAPENRTGAIRTIHGPKNTATRLELRVTGADINPYLAFAGSLAAGLWGIRTKQALPAAIEGNAYRLSEDEAPPLPATLQEATRRLRNSAVAREILGDTFVDHYCATREWEVRCAAGAVTDWELARYFELS